MDFMDGQSNRGIQASASSNRQSVYGVEVIIGGSADPDCAYGVAEVLSLDANTGIYTVQRPSADSQPWQICALMPSQYDRSTTRTAAVAMFAGDNRPVLAAITDDSDAPAIGSTLGTVSGSWKLKVGNTGYICAGVAADAGKGSGGRRIVYVRPSGGGSGGGSFSVVQATADGASGTIMAKAIAFLTDPAARPNFEQTGDALTLRYFRT
jgi:hypothetical protein